MNIDPSFILAVWNFGNLTMLGWLAAAALPWIIHRWMRRPQHTTHWAAVDLLQAAIQNSSRRNQIQQLTLLAIRTLVLILLVVAAADPFSSNTIFGSALAERTHRILIVDQSTSMNCSQDDGTRLDRAKTLAQKLVDSGNPGDTFSVIGFSHTAQNVLGRPNRDKSLVLAAIRGLSQSHTVANVSAAIQGANAAIDSSDKTVAQYEIILFTDLGRNSWTLDPSTKAQIDALAQRAKLTLFKVGDQQRDNIAIVDLTVEPTIILQDQDVEIVAQVRNFEKRSYDALTLELFVDGQFRESKRVDLSANTAADVRFITRFVSEGSHNVQVAVTNANDCQALDDYRWLTTKVLRQLKIACVEGTPHAANDLARALAPGQPSPDNSSIGIVPQVIPASRLPQLDLTNYAAVFFCDVADLSSNETAHTTRYIEQGGNLVVFLGENTSPVQWNELVRDDGTPMLPVQIGSLVENEEVHFDPLDYRHPIVAPFRGRPASGLMHVAIWKYFRLATREDYPAAEIALAIDNGDPAIVVGPCVLGRVAVVALPCSLAARTAVGTPWSSFAVNPSFLPVVRDLVDELVGTSQQLKGNILVGDPLVCRWNSISQPTELRMRMPNGNLRQLPLPGSEDRGQIRFAESFTSGIYRLTANGNVIETIAVNLDPTESDLTTVNSVTLPTSLRMPSTKVAQFQQSDSLQRYAKCLLAAVFLLLIAESTVAWLLGRR